MFTVMSRRPLHSHCRHTSDRDSFGFLLAHGLSVLLAFTWRSYVPTCRLPGLAATRFRTQTCTQTSPVSAHVRQCSLTAGTDA